MLLQVVKYSSDGETWIERAPFCVPDITEDEKENDTREESGHTKDILSLPTDVKQSNKSYWPNLQKMIKSRLASSPRSVSFSYQSPPIPRRGGQSRRMSMHLGQLSRNGGFEEGSLPFRKAMRQDLEHETHPGWDSIRRLVGVVR